MESSPTVMRHPQSPHSSSTAGVASSFVFPPKDPLCTPVPLQSPGPLSSVSPRPSVISSTTTTTTLPELKSAKEAHLHPALMDLDDSAYQWPPGCDLAMSRLGQEVVGYQIPPQYAPESAVIPDYFSNGLPYAQNYDMAYPMHGIGASCPRSYTNGLDLSNLHPNMGMTEAYPPSAYQIEPSKPQEMDLSDQGVAGSLLQLSDDYEHQYATNIKTENLGGYGSPYGSDATRCSTPHDDTPMPPHDFKNEGTSDENGIDKELPYAQLIYRALLEQPDHTMILRDIYNWFKENTDKAADKETKGWQNSIRHNLSMNGVG